MATPRTFLIMLNSLDPSGKTPVDWHHPESFEALPPGSEPGRIRRRNPGAEHAQARLAIYLTLTNMPQAAASAAPEKTISGFSQNALP
ncbi:hypothetical protein SAMN05192541_10895 [Bradyrhizobium arachidis]|nr:hypothetical protein SAMN05192541_10895 [Bradyrhizobium arachidis]